MNGTCDLDVRDCDRDATHDVIITDTDDDSVRFDTLERECCDRHVGWYRREYGERGYDVTIERKEAA